MNCIYSAQGTLQCEGRPLVEPYSADNFATMFNKDCNPGAAFDLGTFNNNVQCREACEKNPACRAVVVDLKSPQCWLKKACDKRVDNTARNIWIKQT